MSSFILLGRGIGARDLIAKTVVFIIHVLGLLLEIFNVAIALGEFFLVVADLAQLTGLAKLRSSLVILSRLTLEDLDFLLESQGVEDHGVGAVENQREEEGEAAEVHVALGVEFASLHFHAFGAAHTARANDVSVIEKNTWSRSSHLHSHYGTVLGLSHLQLHAIDAIDTVNEQDGYEDESNLEDVRHSSYHRLALWLTFKPYCSFAMIGFSDMKVKRPRFQVKGRGVTRAAKTTISNTRSANTCQEIC